MKVEHSKNVLPRWARSFVSKRALLAACDMPFRTGNGPVSVCIKLVLVKNRADLASVSHRIRKSMDMSPDTLGDGCAGFVTQCWYLSEKGGKQKMVVDPRYAAVLVLCREEIDLEIVAHECGHAVLAWMRRWKRNPEWSIGMFDMDEEEDFCYPLGYLVRRVVEWLKEEGVEL